MTIKIKLKNSYNNEILLVSQIWINLLKDVIGNDI